MCVCTLTNYCAIHFDIPLLLCLRIKTITQCCAHAHTKQKMQSCIRQDINSHFFICMGKIHPQMKNGHELWSSKVWSTPEKSAHTTYHLHIHIHTWIEKLPHTWKMDTDCGRRNPNAPRAQICRSTHIPVPHINYTPTHFFMRSRDESV